MITGSASLIQRVAVYKSTPALAQQRDQEIDVKITFSPRSEITRAGGGAGWKVAGQGGATPRRNSHSNRRNRSCCHLVLFTLPMARLSEASQQRPRASTSDAGRYLFDKRGVRELFFDQKAKWWRGGSIIGCCHQAAAPARTPTSLTWNMTQPCVTSCVTITARIAQKN